MNKLGWQEWWWELRCMAPTAAIQEIIEEGEANYQEYYNLELTPSEAYEQDF